MTMPPKKAMGKAKKEQVTPMKAGSSTAMKVKKEQGAPAMKAPKKDKNPIVEKLKNVEAMLKSAE